MASESNQVHLRDYWLILRKRWRMVALSFGVVMVLVAVVTWRQTPIYQASVELVINPNLSAVATQSESAQWFAYDQTFLATQRKRILTRSMMGRAAERLLDHADRFFKGSAPSDPREAKEALTNLLLGSIRVIPDRNTRMFLIQAQHSDPTLVALMANTVAQTYVDVTGEEQMASSRQNFVFVKNELDSLRKKMEEAEQEMLRLRRESGVVVSSSDEPLAATKLADLTSQRAELSIQAKEIEARLADIEAALADGGAEAAADWIKTDEISKLVGSLADIRWRVAELSKRYGEKWPALVSARNEEELALKKLSSAIERYLGSLRAELKGLKERQQIVNQAIADLEREVNKFDEAQIQYSILERELQASKDMYQVLLSKLQEIDMSEAIGALSVSIIEPARDLPPGAAPVRPKRALNMLFGAVVGLFLGTGLAFFQEYLDNTVKTADDVEQVLGVPLLGAIPAMSDSGRSRDGSADGRSLLLISNQSPKSPVAEAYRALRTNIQFSSLDRPLRALLITSGGQGDGKSTTAVNFGTVVAQSGKRVLLVDSDLRRPVLHKALRVPNTKGLTSVLIREAAFEDAVQPTKVENLYVLTSGPQPPNPAELLASDAMRDLVRQAREKYDVVIFDSPPLLPVTDSAVLATEVDGVVMVVGAGRTPREICARGRSMLENVQARVLGAVLNNIQASERGYYYYYYYHRYGYGEPAGPEAKRPASA